MRRFLIPLIVVIGAGTLLLGACSNDSSDTTAAADTEVVTTDAADTEAAFDTEATATDAALDTEGASEATGVSEVSEATDTAAGSDAIPDPAVDETLNQMLTALGVDPAGGANACLHKEVPDLAGALGQLSSAPALLRGLMNCVPEELAASTGKSFVEANPDLTDEQGPCIAKAYFTVLKAKSEEEFAALAVAENPPESVKTEIAAAAAGCGLDAATLKKVLDNS